MAVSLFNTQAKKEEVHGVRGTVATAETTDYNVRSNIPTTDDAKCSFVASILKELHLGNVIDEEDAAFFPHGNTLHGHIKFGHAADIFNGTNIQPYISHWHKPPIADIAAIAANPAAAPPVLAQPLRPGLSDANFNNLLTSVIKAIASYILDMPRGKRDDYDLYEGNMNLVVTPAPIPHTAASVDKITIDCSFAAIDFDNAVCSKLAANRTNVQVNATLNMAQILLGNHDGTRPARGARRAITKINIYLTRPAGAGIFRINSMWPDFQPF